MSTEASGGHKLKQKLRIAIKRSKKSEYELGTKDARKRRFTGDAMRRTQQEKMVDVVTQKKRKRVYDDHDLNKEGTFHLSRRDSSKERKDLLKPDFMSGKRTIRGSDHNYQVFKRKSSPKGVRKLQTMESCKKISGDRVPRSIWVSSGTENATLENKRFSYAVKKAGRATLPNGKIKGEGKTAKEIGSFEMDSGEIDFKKGHVKGRASSTKHLSQTRNGMKYSQESLANATKETVQDMKVVDDSGEINDQPKRRKRIRIDPNDISNKRLDDSILIDEGIKKKKENRDEDVNLSKNAQFRAIQPSPSVLSYVEENLLGRRRLIELRRSGYNIDLSAPLDNIPFSTSSERERIEESVFRNKLTFFAAAKVSSSFPPLDLPEIAFAGRSNVGKSSLLNALTRQWGVVRTSDKPGLTQTINFFELGSKLCLVDLPGYGFAYAKEEVKDAWEELVKEYVSSRVGLKRVCLLIDTKWGLKPRDHELIELMERSKTKYQIVLTKTDAVFPIDVARRAMQIEENLKANKSVVQPLMMVSSKSGAGIRSLRTVLAKIGRFAKI